MIHEGIKEGKFIVNVSIVQSTFENMIREGLISNDQYDIKSINIKKEEYPNDPKWVELEAKAKKAYRDLKAYEFEIRPDEEPKEPAF